MQLRPGERRYLMSIRIFIAQPVHEASLERLKQMEGVEVDMAPTPSDSGPPELTEKQLKNTEALFSTFLPEDHEKMERLKWVQVGSAGYGQLLGARFVERGISATNGSGIHDTVIAEWNLAMMVNLVRNLRQLIRNQEAGIWNRGAEFQQSIRGRVVGFWGYGGLARETARLCKSMGMEVHVLTRAGIKSRRRNYTVPGTGDPEGVLPDCAFEGDAMEDFLKNLDFLVMALPLNAETQGIMRAEHFQALPPGALLLNPARGPLIEEDALLDALRHQWIAGAALDTHYHYPMPADHPLWGFPNVIMTPHISGSDKSDFYLTRLWDIFLQNVGRHMRSEPMLNQISTEDLCREP